ncbi:hypothetical protein [Nocardioides sp.]|uniref:hypothetical protein n=1 Tax=Nocardioides sp. TaxID=35761 RepID=UPI00351497FB
MNASSRPPRRPASSRGGTSRPKRIAGRDTPLTPVEGEGEGGSGDTAATTDAPRPSLAKASASATPRRREEDVDRSRALYPVGVEVESHGPEAVGPLASPRVTRVLTAVIGVLTVALIVVGVLLWRQEGGGDGERASSTDPNGLTVPAGRPVVANQLQVLDGVDAAAKAAQEIVSIDHTKFASEVDAAAKLMTADFAREYRATTRDIERDFVAKRTTVQATVVAQGVVRASRTRLEALVFLNQVVRRTQDGKPDTLVTPFKVLVTMVHTDRGWFVDGLDTDAPGEAAPTSPAPSVSPSPS